MAGTWEPANANVLSRSSKAANPPDRTSEGNGFFHDAILFPPAKHPQGAMIRKCPTLKPSPKRRLPIPYIYTFVMDLRDFPFRSVYSRSTLRKPIRSYPAGENFGFYSLSKTQTQFCNPIRDGCFETHVKYEESKGWPRMSFDFIMARRLLVSMSSRFFGSRPFKPNPLYRGEQ